MKLNRVRSGIAVVVLVLGGTASFAVPALADSVGTMPSGCAISATTPSILAVSGARRIYYGGSAHCTGASSIDYRLVHNYTALPDFRVTDIDLPGDDNSYHGDVCDNGGTAQYYSEIAFYGLSSTVQRVSATVTLNHC